MARAPLRPTTGISGRLSRMPDFSAIPTTAAVIPTLIGVTPPPAPGARRCPPFRLWTRTMGAARGMARRMVGMGWARTIAVVVRFAMRPWYDASMANTSDAELQAFASKTLEEAAQLMGPQPVLRAQPTSVEGDDWNDIADKAAALLKRAWNLPKDIGAKVGIKIRDAARAGLDKLSSASKEAREKLGKVALGAATLAAGASLLANPILLGLVVFLAIEHTGFGRRARSAGWSYVDRRARAHGF